VLVLSSSQRTMRKPWFFQSVMSTPDKRWSLIIP
jgi:hypothetical protein